MSYKNQTDNRLTGLTCDDAARMLSAAAGLLLKGEVHFTSDSERVFYQNKIVSPVVHGAAAPIADEAAMLALNSTEERMCYRGDWCIRAAAGDDPITAWVCINGRGTAIEDWFCPDAAARSLASEKAAKSQNLSDLANRAAALDNLGAIFSSRSALSATHLVTAAEKGVLFEAESGTWSLTFEPVATLGDAFTCSVFNSGGGVITLDPDGSETIRDALSSATTKTLSQGEGAIIVCNGTSLLMMKYVNAMANPMTTVGDIIIGDTSGSPVRLPAGASSYVLTSNGPGVAPSYQASSGGGGATSDALIAALSPLAWYKANAGVENAAGVAATNGQTVLNWLDQSGNGYDLTQATSGNKPLYETGVQNSLPVIRFDGTDDYLLASGFPPVDLGNITVILVGKSASTADFQRFLVLGASGSGNDYDNTTRMVIDGGDTGINFRAQGGTSSEFVAAYNGTRPTPFAVYSVRLRNRIGWLAKNGTSLGDGNVANDTSTTLATSPTGLLMGRAWIGGVVYSSSAILNGDIAEVVIFDRGISDAVVGNVVDALRVKWAL